MKCSFGARAILRRKINTGSLEEGSSTAKLHSLGSITVVPKESTASSDFVFDFEQLMVDANPVEFAPTIFGCSSISLNTSPLVSGLDLILNDQKNNVAVFGGGNHVITNLDYQKDKLKAGHDAVHSNSTNVFALQATKRQLNDISNRLDTDCSIDLSGKWKKLARAVGDSTESMMVSVGEDRHLGLEIIDERALKWKCVAKGGVDNKENIQVAAGIQHHRTE